MNKSELIAVIAEKSGMAKKDADKALAAVISSIVEEVANGGKVQLVGFGTFEGHERKARMGKNPATGAAMEIPASVVPAFKAGKAFKEAVKLVDAEKFADADTTPTTPRLVTGQYFLRVADGAGTNAIAIVPVEVTEGGTVNASVEIKKGYSYSVNTEVTEVAYGGALLTAPTDLDTVKNAESALAADLIAGKYIDGALNVVDGVDGAKDQYTRGLTPANVTYQVQQTVGGKAINVYDAWLLAPSLTDALKVDASKALANASGNAVATGLAAYDVDALETALTPLLTQLQDVIDAKGDLDTANGTLTAKKAALVTLDNTLASADETAIAAAIALYDPAETAKVAAGAEWTTAKSNVDDATTALADAIDAVTDLTVDPTYTTDLPQAEADALVAAAAPTVTDATTADAAIDTLEDAVTAIETAKAAAASGTAASVSYADFIIQTGTTALTNLGAGKYTVFANSPYVTGLNAVQEIEAGKSYAKSTLSVKSAAAVKDIVLYEDADTDNAYDAGEELTDIEYVNNIKVVDANGKVVAETGAYKPSDTDLLENSETEESVLDQLGSIAPGEYKIVVDIPGYKEATFPKTGTQTIIDFQQYAFHVALEEVDTPVVTGYVLFEDNTSVVDSADADDEATVTVYDSKGKVVAASDLANADTYEITSGLTGGETYKFVVRGEGFETTSKTVTVKNGKNTPVNFLVKKGGDGLFQFLIVGEDNLKLTYDTNVNLAAYDENYSSVGPNGTFAGQYKVATGYGTATAAPADNTYKFAGLSKGSYTLAIKDIDADKYKTKAILSAGVFSSWSKAYETTVTLGDVNATKYDTIKVPLRGNTVGELTTSINLTVTGDVTSNTGEIDYIEVVDAATGEIVKDATGTALALDGTYSGTPKYTTSLVVPTGKKYTVNVYFTGGYKATKEVTVQDFSEDLTVDVTEATR